MTLTAGDILQWLKKNTDNPTQMEAKIRRRRTDSPSQ
jgi:hypothetical protein